MDFDHKQSSSSSSSTNELSPTTPIHKHKKTAGRKIFKETRHPIYRGVRRKNGGKWVCEVREPNKKSRIWLGTFPSPETAAVAHDVAALALRGDNAQFNFPATAWRLPRASSSSHQDIQRAAFRAARDYVPVPSSPCSSSSPIGGEIFSRESSVAAFGWKEVCDETITSNDESLGLFLDEEEMFNMPVLLDSMAEGLILTPLAMKKGFNWSKIDEEEDDDGVELTLWGE